MNIDPRLMSIGDALERAVTAELSAERSSVVQGADAAQRHRRRLEIRLVLGGGATAAVALGALSLLGSGAPDTVVPAAAAVIRHATMALAETPGTIWHIETTSTQDNGDGTTVSWSQDSYAELSPPYDSRMINVFGAGTPAGVEQATADGVSQLYDPARNTIYVGPRPVKPTPQAENTTRQHYVFSPGPTPGTSRVSVSMKFFVVGKRGNLTREPAAHVRTIRGTVVVSAAQAQALRNGTDVVRWTVRGRWQPQVTNPRVVAVPRASSSSAGGGSADPFSPAFRNQIMALLRSGDAHVVGNATVDGRDTIEIQSGDGHTTYYVAPGTYTPVELATRGTRGGVVMHFDTYEELPVDGNSQLLSLTAQHPTALIDRNVADYNAAQTRLFPNG